MKLPFTFPVRRENRIFHVRGPWRSFFWMAVALGVPGGAGDAATCSWQSGAGFYDDPMNWDCADPFVAGSNIVVGDLTGDSAVVRLRTSPAIFRLAVVKGAQLRLTNGASLHILNFPNAVTGYPEQEISVGGKTASIVLENTPGDTALIQLPCGDITVSGYAGVGGTIQLGNGGGPVFGSRIAGIANCPEGADTRLLIKDGVSVRGNGRLEDLGLSLLAPAIAGDAGGLVSTGGGRLVFSPGRTRQNSTNDHLIQALGNSTLVLDGFREPLARPVPHLLDNRLGSIAAHESAVVNLTGDFRIQGGLLATYDAGRFSGGGELDGVRTAGSTLFEVPSAETTAWLGEIQNDGRFLVADGGRIQLRDARVDLSGKGQVGLAGASAELDLGGHTLRNLSNRIHGSGHIRNGSFENRAIVAADVPGQPLRLTVSQGRTWTNTAAIEAAQGGVLHLAAEAFPSALVNTSGGLAARAASVLRVAGPAILGGEVSALGAAALVSIEGSRLTETRLGTGEGGLTVVDGQLVSVFDRAFNTGELEVRAELSLENTLTNTGRIVVLDNRRAALGSVELVLRGNGSLVLQGTSSRLDSGLAGAQCVNESNLVRGNGVISLARFINRGTVAPGLSPRILTVSGEYVQEAPGTLSIELGGLEPGAGHSLLRVNQGPVTLAGSLSVHLADGFAPAPGATFIILANNTAGPVLGEFDGLPGGAVFAIEGRSFRIRYDGGDGNDVTLERVVNPPRFLLPRALPDGAVSIEADAEAGRDWLLQATDDLTSPDWVGLGTVTAGADGRLRFVDHPAGRATRFYRAVQP